MSSLWSARATVVEETGPFPVFQVSRANLDYIGDLVSPHINHCTRGFLRCSWSPAKSMVPVRWGCNGFSDSGVTTRHGGWLHKLRWAMVRPQRGRLSGMVEVDETYVGGRGVGVRGRGAERKAMVTITAKVRGRGPGRIRMARISDVSAISLRTFVKPSVCEGAEIHTGGWGGSDLDCVGYTHVVTNISASGDPAHVVMPRVHLVASLLDWCWLGTHQGAILPAHLDYCLDEFTFRFNRRTSRARGLLFYRLMQHAVASAPPFLIKPSWATAQKLPTRCRIWGSKVSILIYSIFGS